MPPAHDNTPPGFSRRRFIFIAAGVTVAGLLYAKRHRIRLLWPDEMRRDKLLRFVGHRGHAHNVGAAYLAAAPDERSLSALLEVLRHDLGVDPKGMKQVQLADAIARVVRSDFRDRRLVSVGGWVLSVTEARIAALTAV
jgi:hypothetical protein